MTTVRRLVAVAAIAPLVSMSAVLAAAGPAQATARLHVPSRVTSNGAVTLSGTVDLLFDAVLSVNGRQVAKGDRKVSYSWNPRDRPNGSYEIKLEQRGKLLGAGWHETRRTLIQAAPPAPPSGVKARLHGNEAVVTWAKGAEPDLRGYTVHTSQTGKVGSVRVANACSGGSCRVTLSVPAKAAGRRIGFTVRALRDDGGGGTLSSGGSAVASVAVPAPRAPRTTQDTGSRDAGGDRSAGSRDGTARQDTGGSADGRQSGKTGRKKDDARQSGVQDLPRLPAKKPTTAPTRSPRTAVAPTEAPRRPATAKDGSPARPSAERDDKRDDKRDAGTATAETGTEPAADPAPTGTDLTPVTDTKAAARSSESPDGGMSRYGILIAGGLILLLLGAHGGAWVRRRLLAADDGGTGGAGAAAMINNPGGDGTPEAASGAAGDTGAATAPAAPRFTTAPAAPQRPTATAASQRPTAPIAPRRPAVILAVVKTGQSPPAPAPPSSARPPSARWGPAHSPVRPAPAQHSPAPAQRVPSEQAPARPVPPEQPPVQRVPSGQPPARYSPASAQDPSEQASAGPDPVSGPVPAPRPGPARLALPVAAPIPEVGPVTPVGVRIGDRWDGYLPPAPRSMEDSGFWERPQPGATDFWAADKDEEEAEDGPSYSGGRRVPGGG
ncbi:MULTISPECIES: hypothetical protein [Streptosporangium]|uniref:Fibronectin type-III domain-containing protein n=1 Tax=Streptosporangium brasiliense TaxID=47480 RepID=A0ABT9R3W5_9ACTN|nr:hypothetical protein [Streptosporangium brasiliense]MDP9863586.1 hypothetical protein [Streptosporangium brasiliense]